MASIPTLRKLSGCTRKLRNRSRKNFLKKHLHESISKEAGCAVDNIHNMGNFILNQDEIQLLNKGLSFVLAPHEILGPTVSEAWLDFKRRMHLHYYFFINPTNNEIKKFHKKSNWQPPNLNYTPLNTYLTKVHTDIQTLMANPEENIQNLSKSEREAIISLRNKKDMIIKPADKGGKIVLWPRAAYLEEANRQLNDTDYYLLQHEDPTANLAMEIETFLTHLEAKGLIDGNCHEFLSPGAQVSIPNFYMLPKIHKANCPGRPIISGCQSPTRALSQYLDFYLKPIVKEIPSYIKDTDHFLREIFTLRNQVQVGDFLVTMDVKSLYTNIPHDVGIDCCLERLSHFYQNNLPLPIQHLEQMFTFILKQNYFEFDKKIYLQIHGTAMGSPFAPNFANIFMHYCEQHILSNAPNNSKPLIWKRFIDDIFMIWRHGEDELETFLQFCNQCFPTIKFTAEKSLSKINFLDTTIYFNDHGILESTLFIKPNDICTLLHNNSFHPQSCKKGIIYSQALRYRRIITDDIKLLTNLEKLRNNLIKRGYHLADITSQFDRVMQYSQHELLFNKKTGNNTTHKNLPFIILYDNTTIKIGPILKKHWHIITNDNTLNQIWNKPPFLALKRNKNIKEHLVRSKYS